MLFYPSRVGNGKRGLFYQPEKITGTMMLNPVYNKVKHLCVSAKALCDSGAFQDIHLHQRLSPQQALHRQLMLRNRIRAEANLPTWNFEAIAIYDQMAGIDEAIVNGQKVKVRGTPETAERAIEETLHAAHYYAVVREILKCPIIFVAQGINPQQYVYQCAVKLLDYMCPTDYFGLGGFCIIGRQRKRMLPIFYETVDLLIPLLAANGITRVHLFGVCLPEAICYLATKCREYKIIASTDSSAPEFAATFAGASFVSGRQKTPKIRNNPNWIPYTHYHPVELAHENVRNYYEWISPL